MRSLVLTLLVALLSLPALAQERVMRITGTGEVRAVPDQATVSMGVVSREATARGALGANAKAMTALIQVLTQAGIAERDIQTSGLSLHPDYARRSNSLGEETPEIVGYVANTQVTVLVTDIAGLGGVLDDLTKAGTNQIGGIGFSVADPAPLLDEARRRAVADARDKARLYAQAAGVTLGELLMLSDAPAALPGPMPMARMESFATDMPVAAGEVGITAQVTLDYAIE